MKSIVFAGDSRTYTEFDSVALATVPLPAAVWMILGGLGCLAGFARRRLFAGA